MIIRIANENDIANLRKLDAKDLYLVKELNEYHTLLDDDNYLSFFLKKKSIFVAESKSKIIGFLIALIRKWTFHQEKIVWIEHVLVDPDNRNEGIAQGMLNYAIEYYIKSNPEIQFVYTMISPENMTSLKLSNKLGFQHQETKIAFKKL